MDWSEFPGGFRDAVILIGFLSVAVGLIVRRTHPMNRGLGMGFITTGFTMIALSVAGRLWGWW